MDERRPRERELVLSPNEYAYVLDTTKGAINIYVGPNKTSLAQTDETVAFNYRSKRFERADMKTATQLFSTAPSGWYMVLKNPEKDGRHPKPGVSSSIETDHLLIGKKVNLHGPTSFPLWPGQMAKVIQGHRLQSNQYLVARIYDAEAANIRQNAVYSGTEGEDSTAAPDEQTATGQFANGQKIIICGTDVSFYMPPTGVEVVPNEAGSHVRDAVSLQRLEYCILVSESGEKAYLKGPQVVFPNPDQEFVIKDGMRKFCAIELSDLTGLYVKVIEPYTDEDGTEYAEGAELFIFGEGKIYFPRREHAIIHYGDQQLHYAVAIPKGEGRYVLNRLTGDVALKKGPCMFLPDPRTEVVTQRVLSDRECGLMYPGNSAVLEHNRKLRGVIEAASVGDIEASNAAELLGRVRGMTRNALSADSALYASAAPVAAVAALEAAGTDWAGDKFNRKEENAKPRTITLNNKFEGAVSVDVWSGFAIQIVDKSGNRRVVEGPINGVLLQYDETLEALNLSTGKPKNTDRLHKTSYLKVRNNYVSDQIGCISSDLVMAQIQVKYLVDFVGDDPLKWFAVDNYVKLLCDHVRSKVKAVARKTPIRKLQSDLADIVRDTVLGARGEGERGGLVFAENSMVVRDVDILYFQITTKEVAQMLTQSQMEAVRGTIQVAQQETNLENQRRLEAINRELEQEKHASAELRTRLAAERQTRDSNLKALALDLAANLQRAERENELDDTERVQKVRSKRLEIAAAEHQAEITRKSDLQALVLAELSARVQGATDQANAFSPQLVAALTRLGDTQLLSSLSENFGELAAVEGKGLLEIAKKFLDFNATAAVIPTLKNGNGSNVGELPDSAGE